MKHESSFVKIKETLDKMYTSGKLLQSLSDTNMSDLLMEHQSSFGKIKKTLDQMYISGKLLQSLLETTGYTIAEIKIF